jgi:hypothetical protein
VDRAVHRVFALPLGLLGALGAVGALVGCGHSSVRRCETLYRDHQYIEAAEAFEHTEDRLASESTEDRAQYGLYRGLTFLRLDDLANARRWLGYAYAVERASPGALMSEEKALLDRGFAELEQRVRTVGVVREATTPVAETEGASTLHPARTPNGQRSISQ